MQELGQKETKNKLGGYALRALRSRLQGATERLLWRFLPMALALPRSA